MVPSTQGPGPHRPFRVPHDSPGLPAPFDRLRIAAPLGGFVRADTGAFQREPSCVRCRL